MARLNRVELIGHTGQTPEVKHTDNGLVVLTFSVATNEGYYDKASEWVDKTEWHRLVGYGERAERWAERIKKGTLLYVEGKLRTRQWEGDDKVTRYTTEIIVSRVEVLEKKQYDSAPPPSNKDAGDDLPF